MVDYSKDTMSKYKDFLIDEETHKQITKALEEEHEYFKNFGRWGKNIEEWDEEPVEADNYSDF